MHAFDLVTDTQLIPLVLRRYRQGQEWAMVMRGLLRTLVVLESAGIPAPRALWSDPDGEVFGVPTVVLTRLRGGAVGRPSDPIRWARQLGAMLARIHAVPIAKYDFSYLPPAFEVTHALLERALAPTPEVAAHPLAGMVLQGLRQLRAGLALERPTFTHGDFWPGQSIWWRGRLEGIIDWDFPRLDDPGIDVGYCRMDIAIMTSTTVADEFLRAYESAAGRSVSSLRFWDLLAAYQAMEHPGRWHRQGFTGIGRPDLHGEAVENKLERLVLGV
jgi:aminoglycoside phosphotransferase (APT) family kinase protein